MVLCITIRCADKSLKAQRFGNEKRQRDTGELGEPEVGALGKYGAWQSTILLEGWGGEAYFRGLRGQPVHLWKRFSWVDSCGIEKSK